MNREFNFSAGPGVLPVPVLEEIASELPVYDDIGTSVLEISHRSATYTNIAESARSQLRSLLGLSKEWHILFLQGGASMQFYQVPLNFLRNEGSADYILTGSWAKKAHHEATLVGQANVAGSSEGSNFDRIPDPSRWDLDGGASYLHYTSNNTIFGTQFQETPDVDVPLVCDASSDFLSRPIDLDRHGLIYAGAQKNIGPAGVTVVLIRDDFLQARRDGLPTMLDYGTHTAKLFNTPPVFAVYAVDKVLRWLADLGGISAIQKVNARKAKALYDAIDSSSMYQGTAQPGSRSEMNVCFRILPNELEPVFVAEAAAAGLQALKGHRSVGGIRASIYNACPEDAVTTLVDFMAEFERTNG